MMTPRRAALCALLLAFSAPAILSHAAAGELEGAGQPGQQGQTGPAPARPADGGAVRGAPQRSGPVRVGPVVVDPQTVDFGVVAPNTTVSTEVKITNATDTPLRILASVPSCQCTSVDMAGVVIEPGSTVPMPMSMKTAGSTGIKMAGVKLLFEGYERTPVEVSIRSEVAYSVRAIPPYIDIQQAPRSPRGEPEPPRPLKGTITLESVDGKPFRVLGFHGQPPVYVGFDPAKDAPQSKYELVYDFTNVPPDQIDAYQIIETDRPDCPALDVRVRHERTHIRPAFKIAEFRSTFGQVAPGETGRFELEIKEFKENRLASAESLDPAQATVRLVDQKGDGTNVLCTFEVDPAPGHKGLVYFPVLLTAKDGKKTQLLVFGRVG